MIQKALMVFFALLTVAFSARFVQYGYKWLSQSTPSPDVNYKVLTGWCAVYILICGAIVWAISKYPRDEDKKLA